MDARRNNKQGHVFVHVSTDAEPRLERRSLFELTLSSTSLSLRLSETLLLALHIFFEFPVGDVGGPASSRSSFPSPGSVRHPDLEASISVCESACERSMLTFVVFCSGLRSSAGWWDRKFSASPLVISLTYPFD